MSQTKQDAIRAIAEEIRLGRQQSEPTIEGEEEDLAVDPAVGVEAAGDEVATSSESAGEEGEYTQLPEKFVDLAGVLGITPDDLYGLRMTLGESGEEISIGQAKDRLKVIDTERREIERAKAEVESQRQYLANQYQNLTQTSAFIDEESQAAFKDFVAAQNQLANTDWDGLGKIDAGRAALTRQKLYEAMNDAKVRYAEAQSKSQQLQNYQWQEAKRFHDTKLLEKVEDWRDPKIANEQISGIVGWLNGDYGFTDQEISGAVDWRYRDIMRKAWLYDQGRKKAKEITATPPRVLSKGITPAPVSADDKVRALIKKARLSKTTQAKREAGRAILDSAFAKRR